MDAAEVAAGALGSATEMAITTSAFLAGFASVRGRSGLDRVEARLDELVTKGVNPRVRERQQGLISQAVTDSLKDWQAGDIARPGDAEDSARWRTALKAVVSAPQAAMSSAGERRLRDIAASVKRADKVAVVSLCCSLGLASIAIVLAISTLATPGRSLSASPDRLFLGQMMLALVALAVVVFAVYDFHTTRTEAASVGRVARISEPSLVVLAGSSEQPSAKALAEAVESLPEWHAPYIWRLQVAHDKLRASAFQESGAADGEADEYLREEIIASKSAMEFAPDRVITHLASAAVSCDLAESEFGPQMLKASGEPRAAQHASESYFQAFHSTLSAELLLPDVRRAKHRYYGAAACAFLRARAAVGLHHCETLSGLSFGVDWLQEAEVALAEVRAFYADPDVEAMVANPALTTDLSADLLLAAVTFFRGDAAKATEQIRAVRETSERRAKGKQLSPSRLECRLPPVPALLQAWSAAHASA